MKKSYVIVFVCLALGAFLWTHTSGIAEQCYVPSQSTKFCIPLTGFTLGCSYTTQQECIGKIQQLDRVQWTVGPVLADSGVTTEVITDCYRTQACGWDINLKKCGIPNGAFSSWHPGDKTVVDDEKECPSPG